MKQKKSGVEALNQEFRRYEQVEKPQLYRLSEDAHSEDFDDELKIHVCDMRQFFDGGAEGKIRFANELGAAMEQIGFVVLSHHGIDLELYTQAEQSVRSFFETIPESEFQPYLAQRQGSVNQGYFPLEMTTIIHPDQVKGWVFCRRAFNLDDDPGYRESEFWPRADFESRFRPMVQAHERLILPIMQSILRYLGCDPHLYDRRLTGANFGFRLNYYPALQAGETPPGGRMLGHEDVDLFTILPASSEEGLQVLNRRNMKWIRLSPPSGSIILNTGDYMQRISNDRLPSTTHRVSQPRDSGAQSRPRISFPMAVYLWEDEMLEVLPGLGKPRYPPIRAETFHTRITSKYYGDHYAADNRIA